jgi:hypothetical protein
MGQCAQRRPLSDLTTREIRERAREYRDAAEACHWPYAYSALLRLATRYEALATQREPPLCSA